MAYTNKLPHAQAVYEFMQQVKEEDPEKYAEVCGKYDVISARQWKRIRKREQSIETLPSSVAQEIGLDVPYEEEDE